MVYGGKMRTFSVKEVREITGLTWKQLYEYKLGIPGIGPMNDAGYKQYSKDDLEKLVQAALLAKLGAKPKDINKAFSNENYDRNKILKELHDKAQKKLVEAQDIITVTEFLETLTNTDLIINPYAIRNLHIFAENLRNDVKGEDSQILINYLEKKGEDELFAEIRKLKDLEQSDIGNETSNSLVRNLKNFGEETIGIDGNRFLMLVGLYLFAIDYFIKRVNSDCGEGKASIISDAIAEYMYIGFSKESDEDMTQLLEYVGRDYDDENVKKCICNLKKSFMKNFGLKTTYELLCNAESMKYLFLTADDLSNEDTKYLNEAIDYVINGIKHYEEEA